MGMQSVRMTDAAINGLPLGSGTYLIRTESRKQDNLRGFMIVCNAASASFVLQRKLNGTSHRYRLGARGEIRVDEARDKAIGILKELRRRKSIRFTTWCCSEGLYSSIHHGMCRVSDG